MLGYCHENFTEVKEYLIITLINILRKVCYGRVNSNI